MTLPSQLLEDAKALGLNVSQACESGLSAAVAAAKEDRWRDENRAAIEAWNAYIDEHGLPLEEYRGFLMARLDVHSWRAGRYVVDVQSGLLRELRTRMIIPLIEGEVSPGPIRDLHPVVVVGGVAHILLTQSLAAVPIKTLGPKIASLHEWHDEITRALDILLVGL